MNCETAKEKIALLLYGELSLQEKELLEGHLEGCTACREEWERERRFHEAVNHGALTPDAALLARCRAEFSARLAREAAPRKPSIASKTTGFWALLPTAFPGWVRAASAVALLAVGFFGARLADGISLHSGDATGWGPAQRVVAVDMPASGKVRVVIEERRHRIMTGNPDREPVRSLLRAAASDPSNPGVWVESVEVLRTRGATEDLRLAYLAALRNGAAAVRLKAIEGLKPFLHDEETRQALCDVLLNDDNPAVRAQAVELLAGTRAPEVLGTFQELVRREPDSDYLRARTVGALREMNASVEIY